MGRSGENSRMVRDTRQTRPKIRAGGKPTRPRSELSSTGPFAVAARYAVAERTGNALAAALFAASRHKKVRAPFNKGIAGAPLRAWRRLRTSDQSRDARCLCARHHRGRGGPAYPGSPGSNDHGGGPKGTAEIDRRRRSFASSCPTRDPMCRRATTSTLVGRTPIGANYSRLRA